LATAQAKIPIDVMASTPKSQDDWDHKSPSETISKVSSEKHFNVDTMWHTMPLDAPPILHYNRYRTDNPWWYHKASREPCKMNSQDIAICHGSFSSDKLLTMWMRIMVSVKDGTWIISE
jgi:hypothetical protein